MSRKRKRNKNRKKQADASTATVDVPKDRESSEPDAKARVSNLRLVSGAAAHRGLLVRIALVVVIYLVCVGAVLMLSAANAPRLKLTGFDAMAFPGEKVLLVAKLERDGPLFFNPDVKGVELEFVALEKQKTFPKLGEDARLDGTVVGSASTSLDGLARLEIKAPEDAGNHLYAIRPRQGQAGDLEAPPTYLMVSVTPEDQPILITDIDNTICETELAPTLSDEPARVAPLEGAPEVLSRVAATHRVVYLTARPYALSRRTRRWLAEHDFPPGPVYLRNIKVDWSEAKYKEDLIRERIKARWKNVNWGVGNILGDAIAYEKNGITPILVRSATLVTPKLPASTKQLKDWKAIGELILEKP